MITLNAADEPDPGRGFTANWSATGVPWLREIRDDTIPLTWPTNTTATMPPPYLIRLNFGGRR